MKGENSLKIEHLADHPHFAPELSELLFFQFGFLAPESSLLDFQKKLQRHLNKDRMPQAYVAFEEACEEEELLGTFSLRDFDMETHKHLSPWIGSLMVHPSKRGQGIGSRLVEQAKSLTKELGYKKLFLFTPDKETWYLKLGWKVVEKSSFNNYSVTVMSHSL